jgi:PAS domain S-box-containing protein
MSEQPLRIQPLSFLAGGGDMGDRMRRKDWSNTALGRAEAWPQSLKTAVRIMLTSRQAIWIGWGPELIYIYNDPYQAIIGGKHPVALGQPTKVVWQEIWDVIGPMLATAMAGDEGTYVESQLLIMERHGYREETYYTFSYSPIPDDDGSAGGIICANTDDTRRVIGERQLALLRELAAATANVRTRQDACLGARKAFESNLIDLPFALIFLPDSNGSGLVLAEASGVDRSHPIATNTGSWPLKEVIADQKILVVDDLRKLFGVDLPTGAWMEPPTLAALIPLAAQGEDNRGGVLVVGLNPFRLFDENYENFLGLVGGQLAASIASAQTYEAERRRAEALAELDRAKTEFFSNVSHEFRTPLTLMLGPIEDMLEKSYTDLTPATKNQLEIVHRNSLRLMKLVNTMLDFSRIEAGRVEANFSSVDLAAYTAELASVFRAAVERAGLKLIVNCGPLPEPVYIDREMWEKIVLNLLSNAFKFTLEGEIEVKLEAVDGYARLTLRDTGVGVPPDEAPRIFERFHRVPESRGRTHEGTGIGLALVQELVQLHSGTISLESKLDEGSRFIVSIPLGKAHLDASRIRALPERASGHLAAQAFVKEAMRWAPGSDPSLDQLWAQASSMELGRARAGVEPTRPTIALPKILWADDNADMRDYVKRLLAERFDVTAVSDGEAALAAIRSERPELVLSDVMMPKLDGFGLLRALRTDPALKTIPVILLSARAGEEARVEGVEAGADDYLIKPFSAREMLARVESHLKMARFRRESETALRESEGRFRQANLELAARLAELQLATEEIRESRQAAMNLMQDAVLAREQVEKLNNDLRSEILEREAAHKLLRQRTAQFETLLNQAPLGVYVVDAKFRIRDVNPTARMVFGDIPDLVGRDFGEVLEILWPKDRAEEVTRLFRNTLESGESYSTPERIGRRADRNVTEFYEWRIDRIPVPDGGYGVVCYFRDISAQVRARTAIAESEERYRSLVSVITDVPWTADAAGAFVTPQPAWQAYTGQAWEEYRGLGWMNAVHPDDREFLRTAWRTASATRSRYVARARLWHAGTRDWRHYEAQAAPLLNADGSVREWTGSCTDNEDRIRAEQQLKVARDDALAANRAKDEFLATLSHELRTPLNPALLVASDSAEDDALPGGVRANFKMIADNISLQARLIDDLLDLNRIIHGKVSLERRQLDLHEVIREATATLHEEITAKRIDLTFSLHAPEHMVSGDPVRLRQVFWNILKNAVKFTPAGGCIEISSPNAAPTKEIEVRVRDSGAGMAPTELARIFHPFVQGRHADEGHHEAYGGLGLGLAISRMLAESHNGSISAESPGPDQGTTIIVRLPLSGPAVAEGNGPEDAQANAIRLPSIAKEARVPRVLFVEDHEATRVTLSRLLRRRGYDVTVTQSVADALRRADCGVFDVLISDLGLPDGDGCTLMGKLRTKQSSLPGIALSGFGMDTDLSRSRAAGFQEHLIKPVSIDSIDRALARVLERSGKSATS